MTRVDGGGPVGPADPTQDRDRFLREMVAGLAETLEGAVGLRQAEGMVGLVAARIARVVDRQERRRVGAEALDRHQVAAALVELKRRIEGGFEIVAVEEDRIELANTRCPFGAPVRGREALCAMTTGVFGRLAADNLGFARVDLTKSFARGDGCCRVTIWLAEQAGRTGKPFHGTAAAR
jgi:predicted ArsR family transcriptional regulator